MQELLRRLTVTELARCGRAVDPSILPRVHDILAAVRSRGEPALRELAEHLDGLERGAPLLHRRGSLVAAEGRVAPGDLELLRRVARRIRAFAEAQLSCLRPLDIPIPGGRCGHELIPVERAGCYAPSGRAPLPSSVLMTVIAARAAGVREVWVATPRASDVMLAAASVAGADGVLAAGGAQAIGAMAIGVAVPRCDVIAGPGNRWVTAAKFAVSCETGIDMLAGPSELVILADDSADPDLIAADLLAQAEHDDDAVPILLTTDPDLPGRVEIALQVRLDGLATAPTARRALANGGVCVTRSLHDAVRACDAIAPEHLQIMARDADSIARRVRHAGALFIGSGSAEVLGDYGMGPNHVLPTGGTARSCAGLSVQTFLRTRTWMRMQSAPAEALEDAAGLARLEGLEGHARAAEARLWQGRASGISRSTPASAGGSG